MVRSRPLGGFRREVQEGAAPPAQWQLAERLEENCLVGLSFQMTILSLSVITVPCSRQQSASTSSPASPSFAGASLHAQRHDETGKARVRDDAEPGFGLAWSKAENDRDYLAAFKAHKSELGAGELKNRRAERILRLADVLGRLVP